MRSTERRGELVDAELAARVEALSHEVGIPPRELVRKAVEAFASGARASRRVPKQTALGKRLRAVRAQIERSGVPLLDARQLDRELAEGRRSL